MGYWQGTPHVPWLRSGPRPAPPDSSPPSAKARGGDFGGLPVGRFWGLFASFAGPLAGSIEKGEVATGHPDSNGAGAAPVQLRGFAGRKGEALEGRPVRRPQAAHAFFDDARAAGIAHTAFEVLV